MVTVALTSRLYWGMTAWRLVALGVSLGILNACVIPFPLGGASHEITDQAVAAIQPGRSTRADVLLLLAEPTVRGERDGHFLYLWRTQHGGALVAFPYPIAMAATSSCHYRAIRFTTSGVVSAVQVFHGNALVEGTSIVSEPGSSKDVCDRDIALRARVDGWLAEPSQ
jgi:hypothetical protein